MILKNSFLSKWEYIYIFNHVDDENKFDVNKLMIKKLIKLKSLMNQESNDSIRKKKINYKSNSQVIYHSYIFY